MFSSSNFSVKCLSLFSSDFFFFFTYVNDNECVCMLYVHIFSAASPLLEQTAITHLFCCARNGSTLSAALYTRLECCWEAKGILHLSTHSNTHTHTHTGFLPQVFGYALLELAPRLVDWMCTQEETTLQTARLQ